MPMWSLDNRNASGLVYKLPASGGGDFLAGQIQRLGEIAGQAIHLVRI
jgi:hypothetical protein